MALTYDTPVDKSTLEAALNPEGNMNPATLEAINKVLFGDSNTSVTVGKVGLDSNGALQLPQGDVTPSMLVIDPSIDVTQLSIENLVQLNSLLANTPVVVFNSSGRVAYSVENVQQFAAMVQAELASRQGEVAEDATPAPEAAASNIVHLDLTGAQGPQVINVDGALAKAGVIIIDSSVDVSLTIGKAVGALGEGILGQLTDRVVTSGAGNDVLEFFDNVNTTVDGGAGDDILKTSGGNDSISGGTGSDYITAGSGNDTISAGLGDDTIDGGAGFDVVKLSGSSDGYTFTMLGGYLVATSKTDATSVTRVKNVEAISFGHTDNVIVVKDDEAGDLIRMYEGVLGRKPDVEGAKWWLEALAQGQDGFSTKKDLANRFLDSAEFKTAHANLDNTQFVELLYSQALKRVPDDAGLKYWVGKLEDGSFDRADVVINISGSPEAGDTISSVILMQGLI